MMPSALTNALRWPPRKWPPVVAQFQYSCQPGQRSVGQRAKAEGGVLWRQDPTSSTTTLCQAGQRSLSAPMESTPEITLALPLDTAAANRCALC
eukprot:350821-Chlamydomonas_euryale.AAC.2